MHRKPEDRVRGQRWQMLGHPLFTGAVMVLAVNDAVLKDELGTWWTGKLSDFAGVFVLAVLAGVVLPRPRLAAAVAGVGFALLKLIPQVAALAAPFLGGITRQDATDLVAIVMVFPAVAFLESRMWSARGTQGAAPESGLGQARERSVVATAMAVTGGVVAVLATSATSCLSPPGVNGFIVGNDGSVMARIGYLDPSDYYSEAPEGSAPTDEANEGSSTPTTSGSDEVDENRPDLFFRWAVSTDGGETWQPQDESPSHPEPDIETATSAAVAQTTACSEALGCFRITKDGVEQQASPGQPWQESFSLSSEERKRIDYRSSGCEDESKYLYRAVTIVDGPEGENVLVAAGTQGVLQRTPDGEWEARAVLDNAPQWLSGPTWLKTLGFAAPLVLGLLSFAVLALGAWRRGWLRGLAGFLLALLGAGGLLILALWIDFTGLDYATGGRTLAALSVLVFVVSIVVALLPRSWLPTGRARPQVPPGPPTPF